MFGVSEKTIRDIWVGRTWKAETQHLDPLLPLEMQHADQAHVQGPLQAKDRESYLTSTRASDQRLVSVEEARWPLTESLNAGSQDKDNLDLGDHTLLGIESDWPSAKQSIGNLRIAWEQAGDHALQLIEPDWPSPNRSIDDLLFDWEQAGSISRL